MRQRTLPPVALAIRFVDCINLGDLAGLTELMTPDHRLEVFDEPAVVGRDANVEAWRGYFEAFPAYVIYPRRIAEQEAVVALVGHTTGSHLGLPDEEERELTLIWLAYLRNGAIDRWRLIEDSEANRRRFGLDESPSE